MTIVTLDVKPVKFVVFLCLIRTTETDRIWQSYSVVIADTGLQSSLTLLWLNEPLKRLSKIFLP